MGQWWVEEMELSLNLENLHFDEQRYHPIETVSLAAAGIHLFYFFNITL